MSDCLSENKGMDFHNHPEMEPDPELVKPLLTPLLTISNRDFKEKYGIMSGSWRGKTTAKKCDFSISTF